MTAVEGELPHWLNELRHGAAVDYEPAMLASIARELNAARLVLPLWEHKHRGDHRPRAAVETAERWLRGEASYAEVLVARKGAYLAGYYCRDVQSTRAANACATAAAAIEAIVAPRHGYQCVPSRSVETAWLAARALYG